MMLSHAQEGLFDDEALDDFHTAALIRPENAVAWGDSGYTYYQMEKYTQAIEFYKKLLSIDSSSGLMHYNQAVAHYSLKQYEEAIRKYDEAMRLGYVPEPLFTELLARQRTAVRN